MILVFDIGTTAVKAGLFTDGGAPSAIASRAVAPDASLDPLRQEADAEQWTAAVRALCGELGAGRASPRCVVVSGNGPTLVPVDGAGRPLSGAITWMDRRAVEESAIVSKASGFYVDPTFYLPKALWFFRNRPDIYDRTASFLSCPEYVEAFLCGARCTFLPAEGFIRYIWDPERIRALGMDPGKFPPYVKTGDIVGTVTGEAAAGTGIPAGTPVVAGGPDFIMSLLGTATTLPGRVCDRAGTSEGINLCARKALGDPRLIDLPHPVEPLRNVSGIISTSGRAVAWFKEAVGKAAEGYDAFLEDAARASPGSGKLLFLPYLCGERAPIWDTSARGVFLGLTLNHGPREMARAVVEATGYAIRDVIGVMESLGSAVTELRITGNPAKSPVWNQIKADITGKPILVPEVEEAELMGNVCVGLRALGEFSRLDEAAEALVRTKKTYVPDPAAAGLYGEMFDMYRKAYAALKPVFKDLDRVSL